MNSDAGEPFGDASGNPGQVIVSKDVKTTDLVALGPAHIVLEMDVIEPDDIYVSDREQREIERQLWEGACETVRALYATHRKNISGKVFRGKQTKKGILAAIDSHMAMLDDPDVFDTVMGNILKGKTARRAVYDTFMHMSEKVFQKMADDYLAARYRDVEDLLIEFQHVFSDNQHNPPSIENIPEGAVLVVKALPLRFLQYLVKEDGSPFVSGIVTSKGAFLDHLSIFCRGMGIAIIHIEDDQVRPLRGGTQLFINGPEGKIYHGFSESYETKYQDQVSKQTEEHLELLEFSKKCKWAETLDGQRVNVYANAAIPEEVDAAIRVNAGGLGLIRTELAAFTNNIRSENDWFEYVEDILELNIDPETGAALPMTIRTVDFEGDKVTDEFKGNKEKQEELTFAQIQAVCHLKKKHPDADIKLEFPNIRSKEEYEAKVDLVKQGMGGDVEQISLPVGPMAEIPGFVPYIPRLKGKFNFVAVGTNDLVYRILGLNRYENIHEGCYDPINLDFLEKLEKIIKGVKGTGSPALICGDIGSDPRYTMMLIGLGYRDISAAIDKIPLIKKVISRIDPAEAKKLVRELKKADTKDEREAIIDKYNAKIGIGPNGEYDPDWAPDQAGEEAEPELVET